MQPMQEDGILRYGDMIQLENVHTESVLSTDFGDEIPLNEENKCFSVTCSRLSQPMLRNVFIIDRPNEKDRGIFDGLNDVLHYGQSFVLRTLPEYTLDEYYVTSTKLSPQIASRYSKQQLVYVTDKKNFEVCWKMQYWDPQLRIENDGEPVRPGSFETQNIQPVIITHSLTGINLCADTVSYPNIFGNEHETFCKNDYDNHRAETNKNRWFIRANQGQ
ncbi:hypothetical protein BLNAU_5613 [Blattamonas nauphoetae]|uniref:Uncharacterized protein n=1 Tax=Blattamonas nauphoetae TaxID=2049346 RepID=A0ABQ9Y6M4_9EUKA|nr:hypothetical protein BLNAU_5613 [Blattamonas nauphoetae]